MKYALFFTLGYLLFTLPACKYFSSHAVQKDNLLAKVGSQELYASEVTKLMTDVSAADSLKFITNYAETWVRKKLLLQKAEENISTSDMGIDKQVEDYRETLLLHEYEKELINQKLDNALSEKDISNYYEKNKANFVLEADIYLVQNIRLRQNAAELDKTKPILLNAQNEDEKRKMEGYCKAYASSYSLEGAWMGTSKCAKEFSISTDEVSKLFNSKKVTEFTVNNNPLFLKIVAVKSKGEVAPLPYILPQIKEALTNKEKVTLIEKIYQKIYEDGIKNKCFELYVGQKK